MATAQIHNELALGASARQQVAKPAVGGDRQPPQPTLAVTTPERVRLVAQRAKRTRRRLITTCVLLAATAGVWTGVGMTDLLWYYGLGPSVLLVFVLVTGTLAARKGRKADAIWAAQSVAPKVREVGTAPKVRDTSTAPKMRDTSTALKVREVGTAPQVRGTGATREAQQNGIAVSLAPSPAPVNPASPVSRVGVMSIAATLDQHKPSAYLLADQGQANAPVPIRRGSQVPTELLQKPALATEQFAQTEVAGLITQVDEADAAQGEVEGGAVVAADRTFDELVNPRETVRPVQLSVVSEPTVAAQPETSWHLTSGSTPTAVENVQFASAEIIRESAARPTLAAVVPNFDEPTTDSIELSLGDILAQRLAS